jgi:hypothetical protein
MSVVLKESHLNDVIEALELVVIYKSKTLRKRAWDTFKDQWLISAIEQINANEFKLNHPTRNTLMWIVDQMCWSRVIIDGVDPKDCVPLIDTRLGERVAAICRAGCKGQLYYDSSFTQNNFHDLFDV